jgi:hypothetical protein
VHGFASPRLRQNGPAPNEIARHITKSIYFKVRLTAELYRLLWLILLLKQYQLAGYINAAIAKEFMTFLTLRRGEIPNYRVMTSS